MKNKKLIAAKIERARQIIARSRDTTPPRWALLWSQRQVPQSGKERS